MAPFRLFEYVFLDPAITVALLNCLIKYLMPITGRLRTTELSL